MRHGDGAPNLELFGLGLLVPKGRRVLVIGKDGARLVEVLGAVASHFDPGRIEGGVSLAELGSATPEVAVLVGGLENCGAYLSLIRSFADNCIPLVYASRNEQAERESAAGRITEQCYEVIRFSWRDEMNVCFAIPLHCLSEPTWLQSHTEWLRKRLERQRSKAASGKDFRSWERRDRIVARWVPKGLSIADVGCGAMTAEKLLRPRAYLPIDVERRDERTRLLDLNVAEIPASWLENIELVLFLGVLEYVDEPLKHLARVASLSKRMVVSYNVFERRNRLRQMTAGRWKSALRDEDLRQAFAAYRYDVEASIEMGRQSLYLVKPEGAVPLSDGSNNTVKL